MSETSDQFVRWFISAVEDMGDRTTLDLMTEAYDRSMKVELGVSLKADALTEHEKYTELVAAGFTKAEAFQHLLSERAAIMSAAVTEQIRQQSNSKNGQS